jgi:hypothetical protein
LLGSGVLRGGAVTADSAQHCIYSYRANQQSSFPQISPTQCASRPFGHCTPLTRELETRLGTRFTISIPRPSPASATIFPFFSFHAFLAHCFFSSLDIPASEHLFQVDQPIALSFSRCNSRCPCRHSSSFPPDLRLDRHRAHILFTVSSHQTVAAAPRGQWQPTGQAANPPRAPPRRR